MFQETNLDGQVMVQENLDRQVMVQETHID